ncbi:MAG: hypothetical protein KBD31_04860 [Proteobacteria bacterium]|nr:hypothetical protein [Pseudomonadota bacterium]
MQALDFEFIKEKTVKKYHCSNFDQRQEHIQDFLKAYNCGKKLKALNL